MKGLLRWFDWEYPWGKRQRVFTPFYLGFENELGKERKDSTKMRSSLLLPPIVCARKKFFPFLSE